MNEGKWRLPHGVEELLPPAAMALETLRRKLVDLLVSWGYEHVEPPLVEYLDSLLVGGGPDLDLQTLKIVDQRSGRMLGVRADLTSQAVRIDAHSRPKSGIHRLCYAGPVVFANPRGALDTRNPFKVGAELFGCAGIEADAEVVNLMLASLEIAGVSDPVLLLGHMGIYRTLVAELDLSEDEERRLFDAVQRKAESDVADLLPKGPHRDLLASLPNLMGDHDVLERARRQLTGAAPAVLRAIDDLEGLAGAVQATAGVKVRFDFSELAGYGYHNGPVFSAYQSDQGASIAQGGRYDGIGASFGRARPATGFDIRLERLVKERVGTGAVIWAPHSTGDKDLDDAVASARKQGQIVVRALGADEPRDDRCVQEFVLQGGAWTVKELEAGSGS